MLFLTDSLCATHCIIVSPFSKTSIIRASLQPIDCYTDRDLLLVEDQLPGPILRVNVGDTVHIKWHNRHPSEGVSIHYHGLLMKDQPYVDGAGGISTCVVGTMY